MSVYFLADWQGVAGEPMERCEHCGFTFSCNHGPTRRETKREHRKTCPSGATTNTKETNT